MFDMFFANHITTVLLTSCAAGAAANAYYRAECETADGVTRLANLVKVQKAGDVAVPGTWTVLGGADAVTFENGRIVIKGGLRFDSQGAPFSLTGREVVLPRRQARRVQPQLDPRPRASDEWLVPLGARLPFFPPADHRPAVSRRHVLRTREATEQLHRF